MLKKYEFKTWMTAAGIRAIKTMAQTALGIMAASMLMSEVDWIIVFSASALSGLSSLLTSVAGLPELDGENIEHE